MNEITQEHEKDSVVCVENARSGDAEAMVDIYARSRVARIHLLTGLAEDEIRHQLFGANDEGLHERIERWGKRIETQNNTQAIFVARQNNKVVGFVAPNIEKDGRRRLGGLYVAPEAQGQGVGSKLIEASFAWHGLGTDIYLHTDSDNENAIRLYRKFGFVETGRTEDLPEDELLGRVNVHDAEMMRHN